MRRIVTAMLLPCFLLAVSIVRADDQAVKLEKKDSTVAVTIGGKEFTTFHFAKDQPKPYFSPVRAADGAVITREIGLKEDHPHHKGIWLSIDEVNGIRFWAEKGKIENASVELTAPSGNPAKMKIVNNWLGEDGKPVLIETTEVSFYANRLLTYDVKFTAGEKRVTFDDTKEGMFGIRMANSIREKQPTDQPGGHIVNAEGLKSDKECWGKESKWVDYFGPVEGKTYGVTIMDNPKNFRRSRYHVRAYGLFTISPFGQKAYTEKSEKELPADPFVLEPGKSARLRYGLAVHEGDTQQGKVAELYDFYLKHSGE